ncbi:hypothetical protein DKG77_13505 [Flagellimonas aquimarina]|uniref:Uncharacterized protein n=1 Tax=Flagellimonas aquimarina TaxID=2201895 RepID=A0A316KYA9_9FLAO|nr:hypothetical protein [Allomuricauda koreensis]PWL37785.1 hypothetical protein DKG77_13505 [Allomuricauda koreensis]
MDANLRKRHKYNWLLLAIIMPILLVLIIKDLDFDPHENGAQESTSSASNDMVNIDLIQTANAYIVELNVKSPLKSAASIVYALDKKGVKGTKLGQINGVGSYTFPSEKEINGILIQDVIKNQEILKLEF